MIKLFLQHLLRCGIFRVFQKTGSEFTSIQSQMPFLFGVGHCSRCLFAAVSPLAPLATCLAAFPPGRTAFLTRRLAQSGAAQRAPPAPQEAPANSLCSLAQQGREGMQGRGKNTRAKQKERDNSDEDERIFDEKKRQRRSALPASDLAVFVYDTLDPKRKTTN